MKVRKKKKGKNKYQYIVKCHVSDKSLEKVSKQLKAILTEIQNPKDEREERKSINLYNATVIGIHNYYKIANKISKDMNKISFRIYRLIKAKLRNRVKKKISNFKDGYIKNVYGKSKQMRFVNDLPLIPIGYIQHKIPKQLNSKVNKYTEEGRNLIHTKLECVDIKILKFILNNPVEDKSTKYNDNILSRYCGQLGKCYITGKKLNWDMEYIYKNPKAKGLDNYNNILIIDRDIKNKIFSDNIDLIKNLKLKEKSIEKVNELRKNRELSRV